MMQSSSSSYGASSKPSWAFDVADGSPRSKATLQNYRIPYPRSPTDDDNTQEAYLCARLFLVIANVLFFVVGFSMVIMSIVAASKPETCLLCYSTLCPLLITGMVTALVASIGLYGAAANSYKMLIVYVTFVAFVFMVQLVVFFWSLFGRSNFKRRMHSFFSDKMRHHPGQLTELLELVQQRLPCCGVDGPMDYHAAGLQLPISCCRPSATSQCTVQQLLSSTAAPQLNTTTAAVNTTATATTITNSTTDATANVSVVAVQRKVTPSAQLQPLHAAQRHKDAAKRHKIATQHQKITPQHKIAPHQHKKATQQHKITPQHKIAPQQHKKATQQHKKAAPQPKKAAQRHKKAAPQPKKAAQRHKRSFSEPSAATPELSATTAGPEAGTTENGTVATGNATDALTGNFSVNGTTETSLADLFNNRTNLTGGPEPWDIHHVQTRGCYTVMWTAVDGHHALVMGITFGLVLFLSLQLVVLCMAHRVARAGFVYQQ